MFEKCPLKKIGVCPFCFSSYGELYCGIASPKKHKTNKLSQFKKCPKS